MDGEVRLERSGALAEMVIDRPHKHHALTPSMYGQICDICAEVDRDDGIHALLIRSTGAKAFCAGSDVNALKTYKDFWDWRNRADYIVPIRRLRKPAVVALKGWVLGGGLEIALACDIRVSATDAVFAAPEVGLGWVGAGGAAQHLTRLVGYGQAMSLMLTGDRMCAERAFAIGLVEHLVAPGEEEAEARLLAQRIASHRTVATQAVKSAVRAAMSGNIELGHQMENELMSLCFAALRAEPGASPFDLNASERHP